ncbi:MAG: ABC transporter ATP-binding protein [Candidatus Beckwithbacteria bacterium]
MKIGLSLSQVSFAYQKNKPVLKSISLEIKPTSFLAISGNNGSGKSTLSLLLNGLIPNQIQGDFSGQVLVDGVSTAAKPVSFFASKVGLVFQNPDFSIFNLTVQEELLFGLTNLKLSHPEQRINHALKQVRMASFLKIDPQTLSYGQKQKICLAAVLALNPDYLVLDEPTSMLDHRSSVELYQILTRLNQQGKTIIVVEHHLDLIKTYTQQTLILDQGKIAAFGLTKSILAKTKLLNTLGLI